MYKITNGYYAATFIHIPKTGGTAITHFLKSNFQTEKINRYSGVDMRHVPIKFLRSRIVGNTFAFVRHPLRWYESVYKMLDDYADGGNVRDFKQQRALGFNPIGIAAYFYEDNFSDWIDNILAFAPDYYLEVVQQFLGEDYKQVDYIGHTESLESDLRSILDENGLKVNVPQTIKRHGGRQHKNDLIVWGEGQQEKIMKANERLSDCEHFKGYYETFYTDLQHANKG